MGISEANEEEEEEGTHVILSDPPSKWEITHFRSRWIAR